MKEMRGLLDGTADPKSVSTPSWIDASVWKAVHLAEQLKTLALRLAEAALACKDEKLARSLLEKAELRLPRP